MASFLTADIGSEVNISGGTVIDLFVSDGSEVNISGGEVGLGLFEAVGDNVVNISGGQVGGGFGQFVVLGNEVNISGGSFGPGFTALDGSEINLFGSDFSLNGELLDGLALGETFTITDRSVTLSGLLDDGSPFSFDLNNLDDFELLGGDPTLDLFLPEATVTVTLTSVPEPTSTAILLLGCGLVGMRRTKSKFV